MPRSLPGLFLVLAALGCSPHEATERARRAESRATERGEDRGARRPAITGTPAARLVVLIVIDQLPSWSFEAILPHLQGGIGRLVREGTYYTHAELPYANTYTASGHAALGTGAPPRDTCIVANDWHRDGVDKSSGSTDDPDSPLLGPSPPTGGESSRWLCADGVADVLERETAGRAHTIAMALKGRAAILATGRHPDLAVWWDPSQSIMTTSRAYAASMPAWLDPGRGMIEPPARFLESVWQPTDPKLLAEIAGAPDDAPGEGGMDGLGAVFPHALAGLQQPAHAILSTPFATRILLDTAHAAVHAEQLGADQVPDLLSISISSHDYAGHSWGQESWERVDVLLDIDRELAVFFRDLDRELGPGGWAAVLTSDHGALPLAARRARGQPPVYTIDRIATTAAVEKAAERVLGPGPWAVGVTGNIVHLTRAFVELPDDRRARGMTAMTRALEKIPGMGLVEPTRTLSTECDDRDPARQRACRSFPPSSYDAIYALPKFGSQYIGEHPWGAGHGCGSELERNVPVLVRVPGAHPRVVRDAVSFLSIAPTLSALLGVAPPPKATAPKLP